MKNLYVQYCYSNGEWGLYDPEIDEVLYLHESLKQVVNYAYELAELIKPCTVKMVPQYFLNSYTICASY